MPVSRVSTSEIGRGSRTDDPSAADASAAEDDPELKRLPAPRSYEVAHSPFVFLRLAPSTDAEVLTMLPAGAKLTVDATRNGWARTAEPIEPFGGGQARRGWGLISGESLGLGVLLRPAEPPEE